MDRFSKKNILLHRCVQCHKLFPHAFKGFCDCGGMIDIEYKIENVTLYDSPDPFVRFADLLPLEDSSLIHSPRQEYTPCVHAKELGKFLGLPNLYLKNETVFPTGTTKDRMACVAMAYLWECGIRKFAISSTGNSSTSYSHAIKKYPDCQLYLFSAEQFWEQVHFEPCDQIIPFVLKDASFVQACEYTKQFAQNKQITFEQGFFNPGRREGLKTAFLEASEQVPGNIDWYVQAVSSAMGVYGVYKGAKELLELKRISILPKLLCVQQESCAPIVNAYKEGCDQIQPHHLVERPYGIARAILRGNPGKEYPYIKKIVQDSKGTLLAVSEQEIREARKMVEEMEGIFPCFAASCAMAGLIKKVRNGNFPKQETILVNLTGSDRKPAKLDRKAHRLVYDNKEWKMAI